MRAKRLDHMAAKNFRIGTPSKQNEMVITNKHLDAMVLSIMATVELVRCVRLSVPKDSRHFFQILGALATAESAADSAAEALKEINRGTGR